MSRPKKQLINGWMKDGITSAHGHFWYSKKAAHYLRHLETRPFALIDGELYEYTYMSHERENDFNWDDMRYLGEGEYHHSEKRS